ncbi:PAS domain S-box protein [uncultured Desulfobacter sp.]|uniref:PAS domain-containing hybrid sensor histidine kinase/response regulator n=1 Tax=uncultured Desulfobacter sp. TaxID=240139 RepID=UPI0029F4EB86|nr:PAS domain S-box protein [uncultured Desulfobacter sp.]
MVRRVFKLFFVTFFLLLYAVVPDRCLAHNDEPIDFLQSLTDEERQWLKAHPLIRLGNASDRPPFEFIDKQGQSQGIVADYIDRWVSLDYEKNIAWRNVLTVSAPTALIVLIIIGVVLMGNKRLKREIIKRQQTEKLLLKSEELLHFALESAGAFHWQIDMPSREITYSSLRFFVSLGYLEKEAPLTLEHFFSLVHPDDIALLDEAFQKIFAGETILKNDFRLRRKHAGWAWVHAAGQVVEWNAQGQVAKIAGLTMDITERRSLLEKITQSQERFLYSLETADALYWQTDLKNGTYFCEPYHLFIKCGYTQEEIPKTIKEYNTLVHPDDTILNKEKLQQCLQGKITSIKTDYRFRRKNSDWAWFTSVGKPVEWDETGRASKFAGITMDITERLALHQQVKSSQEQLRIISEHTHDWQSWQTLSGKLLWVNKAVKRMTGYTVAECMAMKDYPLQIYDKRDWDAYSRLTNMAIERTGRQETQLRVRRKDGSLVWVSSAYEPVLDKNGQIIGLAGAAKDITKQIKAEQGLRLLSKVFEDSSDPILITDLNGNIVDLNVATVEAYGYSRRELIGKHIEILASYETDITHQNLYRRCIKGEVLKNIEGTRVRKDGTVLPHLFTYSLLKDDKGKHIGIASIAKDITWIKEAEKELEDHRDHLEDLVKERTLDLEEARRVAENATRAKSDFLANMSHEIRTPLNAIIGFAHLALQTELDSRQHDYIHKIQNGSKALLGVINDILDFSKIEAGKLNMESIEFSLEDVLETVTNLVGIKAQEKGLEVIYNIDPNIPHKLIGDPIRLGQIFLNLTNNAVKFTKEGEIIIGCAVLGDDANETQLEFYVQDTGIGLTQTQQDRLFQAFSQADSSTTRKYGGTGLGLFISKFLVEMMNGQIQVKSEYGRGTTFIFTVYLKRVDVQTIASHFAAAENLKKKILVVDDNPISRTVLGKMLKAMSFQAIEADNAETGMAKIETAREQNKPFDLILMDWQMPGMDGLQAFKKIKTVLKEKIPTIIMVSAYAREKLAQKGNRLGLDGYLIKPVSPSSLFDSIITVLGEKKHLHFFEHPKEQLPSVKQIQGAKFLLAEDNEVNQQVAKGILENNGFVVDLADNGLLALEAVQKTEYDAVLMDINMPEMDGYTASRKIRQLPGFKDLPIIAMTANAMTGDREKTLAAGMNDYVTKPIDVKQLLNALRTWVKPSSKKSSRTKKPVPNKGIDPNALSDNWGPLPGIDIQEGVTRLAGDMNLYRDLLKKFAGNQADTVDKIQQALRSGDIETAQRITHAVKGVSGNISATLVFESATQLDDALKNKDIQTAETLLPDFSTRLSDVIKVINGLE